MLERKLVGLGVNIGQAEISLAVEGGNKVMSEKVDVVAARRRRTCPAFNSCLEEIPEDEREHDVLDEFGSDGEFGGCCCSDEVEIRSEGGFDIDRTENHVEMEIIESEMEGIKWAVDLGFWVMCLGLGFWVSRGSSKRLRRGKFT